MHKDLNPSGRELEGGKKKIPPRALGSDETLPSLRHPSSPPEWLFSQQGAAAPDWVLYCHAAGWWQLNDRGGWGWGATLTLRFPVFIPAAEGEDR